MNGTGGEDMRGIYLRSLVAALGLAMLIAIERLAPRAAGVVSKPSSASLSLRR
jgi:hypothetical protein